MSNIDPVATPLAELLSLEGRTAVVTGGGRGIGRSVALRLAEAGALVFVADVDGDAAEQVAAEIREAFATDCRSARVDISDSDSVRELSELAAAASDRLDIWVNTAAIFATTAICDTPDEIWHKTIQVDLDGSFFCAREAARQMTSRGAPGVIVLFTSLAAHKGRVGRVHYNSAKHGVKGLMRSLAVELGPAGVRVLAVAPGVIETRAVQRDSQFGDTTDAALHEELMERAIQSMPMGRLGDPDELARAVVFAVSDMAQFMTGSTLHVDGGASAH